MQTVKGEAAASLCKEEFQLFFTEFVVPLCDQALEARVKEEDAMDPKPRYKTAYGYITLHSVRDHARETLEDAYRGLEKGLWYRAPNVPMAAYKPTSMSPFFVTLDNGPAHSFWLGRRDWLKHMPSIGISLLQVLFVCPHGHDLHQTVEHCNSVIKRKCKKELAELCCCNPDLKKQEGCKVVFETVGEQVRRICEQAFVDHNLERLRSAIQIVAAKKGKELVVKGRSGKAVSVRGTAGGFSPLS